EGCGNARRPDLLGPVAAEEEGQESRLEARGEDELAGVGEVDADDALELDPRRRLVRVAEEAVVELEPPAEVEERPDAVDVLGLDSRQPACPATALWSCPIVCPERRLQSAPGPPVRRGAVAAASAGAWGSREIGR